MPTYGIVQRAKTMMRVLRGYAGQSPDNLSESIVVDADTAILSGQIVIKDANGKATVADAADNTIGGKDLFIAQTDNGATQPDTQASGKIHCFNLNGNYEFQTGYYKTGETYTDGVELTIADGGLITPASSSDVVIGKVTRQVGSSAIRDLTGENSEATDLTVVSFIPVARYTKA
jgi:hypothetical protein